MRAIGLITVLFAWPIVAQDRLPPGVLAHFGEDRYAQDHSIDRITMTGDGKYALTEDVFLQEMRLWEVETGREFTVGGGAIPWSDRTSYSAIGATRSTILLSRWQERKGHEIVDAFTGKAIAQIESGLPDIALMPDGESVVIARKETDVIIAIVHLKTKKCREITRFANIDQVGGLCLCPSPDGSKLAVSWDDGTRVFDTASGAALIHALKTSNDNSEATAFSPDGKLFVKEGRTKRELRFWNTRTGEPLPSILSKVSNKGRDAEWGRAIAFSPDGKLVVHLPDKHLYRVIEHATGKTVTEFDSHGGPGSTIAFLPDGKRMLTADGNFLVLRDVRTGKILNRPPNLPTGKIAWTTSGQTLAIPFEAETGRIDLVSSKDWKKSKSLDFENIGQPVIAWHTDDKSLVIVDGFRRCRTVDVATGKLTDFEHIEDGFESSGRRAMQRTRSGQYLIHDGNSITRLDKNLRRTGAQITADTMSAKYLPLADAMAVFSARLAPKDAEVRLGVIVVSRADLRTVLEWEGNEYCIGISPDMEFLVLTDEDDNFRLAKASDLRTISSHSLKIHRVLHCLAFSDDGQRIATVGTDKRLWILEARTGLQLASFEPSREPVELSFSPNGQYLVVRNRYSVDIYDVYHSAGPVPRSMEAAWNDLKSNDGTVAQAAMRYLVHRPEESRKFVSDRLGPPLQLDPRLVAQLSSNRYAEREAATKSLLNLGPMAKSALRDARKSASSDESQTRLDRIIAAIDRPLNAAELQPHRAEHVLRMVGGKRHGN